MNTWQGDDLTDEVFDGAPTYENPVIVNDRKFLPWHRPRKQFVRDRQWRAEIEALLTESPITEGPLRYLGLPGNDLIDLRYIHDKVCMGRGLPLRFLGFNSGAGPRSPDHQAHVIALDEVKRLTFVDNESDVVWDPFELLARQNSLAGRAALLHGPYDVVNLDLCDGFGKEPPARHTDSLYRAITSLMGLQALRTRPWLFFLTTRTDKPSISAQFLQVLVDRYLANMQGNPGFLDESRNRFGIQCAASLATACDTDEGHLRVFLTALSKWFIHLGLQPQPPKKVEVRSVFGYRVMADAGHEDLVSIAFRITPTFHPVADGWGLAPTANQALNEGDLATRALRRIDGRKDADQLLATQEALRTEMVGAMGDLLASARYDRDRYLAWVQGGEVAEA